MRGCHIVYICRCPHRQRFWTNQNRRFLQRDPYEDKGEKNAEYIVADKNVGGLQISVDDMSMVHIVESANHLVPTAMEGQEKAYVISLMTSWDKCFLFEM